VVWALGHCTTWAHDKMEWTLCYLGARRKLPRVSDMTTWGLK